MSPKHHLSISFCLFVGLCCFVSAQTNLQLHEDEFTFDLPEDLEVEFEQKTAETSDYVAVVGKVFHLALPQNGVKGFIARELTKNRLPHWLVFSKKSGVFWGVPLQGDEGIVQMLIAKVGEPKTVENITIHVINSGANTGKCKANEDETVLTLLVDKNLRTVKPKQRVATLNNIAQYLRIPYTALTWRPQYEKDDISDSSVVLAGPGNVVTKLSKTPSLLEVPVGCDGRLWEASAGMVQSLKQQARDGTIAEVLRFPLLGWRVKTEPRELLRKRRQAAVEDYGSGDYDEDYYGEYDDDYDEDNLGDLETNPPIPKVPVTLPARPTTPSTTTTTTGAPTTSTSTTVPSSTHPHRHHHGEVKPSEEYSPIVPADDDEEENYLTTPITSATPGGTRPKYTDDVLPPAKIPLNEDDYDYGPEDDEDDDDGAVESETVVPDLRKKSTTVPASVEVESAPTEPTKPSAKQTFEFVTETEPSSTTSTTTSTTTTTTSTTTTTEAPTTFEIVEDTEPPMFVTDVTIPAIVTTLNQTQDTTAPTSTITASSTTSTTTTSPSTASQATTVEEVVTSQATTPSVIDTTVPDTTVKSTTVRQISSTTTESFVTEQVDPVNKHVPIPRNYRPYIEKRLQYKTVMAGKVFRFVIPKDTFKDAEDGYNLTLQVLEEREQPLSANSWLQFNPLRRELYGLPLAEDIHTWEYTVRATDREGEYEQDQLTIQVQQHPLERVFNHEFSLALRIEKPQEYQHYIDWSLKVLRALGKIYSTNMSEITVRKIDFVREPVVFTWSNDSLSSNFCPRTEIETLFKMLTANDRGDPSRELSEMLKSDLRVKLVSYRNLSTCIEQPPPPPVTAINNFSPVLRNPVDVVNATLGELLIVKVKDDTFYDPEDVDPSMLNITLQTADFQPIPASSWLQFDNKNREFFGIPRKTGVTQYWLMCVDSGGKSAKDSLEVHVRQAEKIHYNVEFSMTLEVPFETFSSNAVLQKKFVEKLMEIFEEPSPKNLHFLPFKQKIERNTIESTLVHWFNKSLPVDRCPIDEINRLEYMLHNSESRSISRRVHRIMGPDFTISTIKVHHIGNCKAKPVAPTQEAGVPTEETVPPSAQSDYLITYIIPAVIISIMLFVASVAACVLYRKRRMGKMNVEEDGRQTYGNKGIPVIFQEELEEKPEPGTKAPVILKDERPPLAPPEYSKSGSVKLEDSEPYQPPPPFTRSSQDNGRQPRPKPTPTYRKPPPYVPP
ncbi:dystroglycan [Sitophilus oryzae]|uniref:Dystroglycan 1 n=1 Tax=Sitophilus oryzae TaxID=7048 RepID=A0A6J2YU17_SITOR|nr:dystroglycan [Sitophilus oryzae]